MNIITTYNLGGGGLSQPLITIESKIDTITKITPSGATTVTGLTDGSDTIQCDEFAGSQVEIFFGDIPVPSYDRGDGGLYYTKTLISDTITLSQTLSADDSIVIKIFGHRFV